MEAIAHNTQTAWDRKAKLWVNTVMDNEAAEPNLQPLLTRKLGLEVYACPIRSTAVKLLNTCARKFMFACRLGLTKADYSPALEIGTTVHQILAQIVGGESTNNVGLIIAKRVREIQDMITGLANEVGVLPDGRVVTDLLTDVYRDHEMTQALVEIYLDMFPPERLLKNYKVYSIEQTYAIDVPGLLVPIIVQPDIVLQSLRDGKLWILDYKTLSGSCQERAAVLGFEFQPRLYAWVVENYLNNLESTTDKFQVGGWIHNLIKKPTIRYCPTGKDKGGWSGYLERVRQWYRDEAMKSPDDPVFLQSIVPAPKPLATESFLYKVYKASHACSVELNLKHYPENTEQCFGRFGKSPCPYLPLCSRLNPVDWAEPLKLYKQAPRDAELTDTLDD